MWWYWRYLILNIEERIATIVNIIPIISDDPHIIVVIIWRTLLTIVLLKLLYYHLLIQYWYSPIPCIHCRIMVIEIQYNTVRRWHLTYYYDLLVVTDYWLAQTVTKAFNVLGCWHWHCVPIRRTYSCYSIPSQFYSIPLTMCGITNMLFIIVLLQPIDLSRTVWLFNFNILLWLTDIILQLTIPCYYSVMTWSWPVLLFGRTVLPFIIIIIRPCGIIGLTRAYCIYCVWPILDNCVQFLLDNLITNYYDIGRLLTALPVTGGLYCCSEWYSIRLYSGDTPFNDGHSDLLTSIYYSECYWYYSIIDVWNCGGVIITWLFDWRLLFQLAGRRWLTGNGRTG